MFLTILAAAKYKLSYIISLFAFGTLFSVIALTSTYYSIMLTILAIFVGYFIRNIDVLVSYSFRSRLIATIIIIISHFMGIISTTLIERDGSIRDSLGFFHPNTLGVTLLFLSIEYVFLRWNTWRARNYLFPICCFLISHFVANSRGATVGLFLLLVFSFVKKLISQRTFSVFGFVIVCLLIVLLPAFSIWMMINYDGSNSLSSALDNLSSLRFSFGNAIYKAYGLNFFGQNIPTIVTWEDFQAINGYGIVELDNMYMSLALRNGLLYFISFLSIYFLVSLLAFKQKDTRVLVIISVLLVFGMFEVLGAYLQFNTMFFMFGYLIRRRHSKSVFSHKETRELDSVSVDFNGVRLNE
ncbi:polysaccharide polymerase [Lacticaseibacillus rhamnosus]|nr:polysaccharide polymerase [Lacticaseibacillus rhamnosus]